MFATYAKDINTLDSVSYTKENVSKYSKFGIEGTSWLSFRDIPFFVEKYIKGKKTLDFGCGSGRSTRFLKSLDLDVVGVDISTEYLDAACKLDPNSHYFLSKKEYIPVVDNCYDFVFSSHVLFMLPSKKELDNTIKEICRILKKKGIFIAVTGSEEMHSPKRQWLSYETDFPENYNPPNGGKLKIIIKGVEAVFFDYHWTDENYCAAFESNGFEILERHLPLGNEEDGYEWFSEKEVSPYIVYVLKKS
jgi:SAM-dependent methyltransferase